MGSRLHALRYVRDNSLHRNTQHRQQRQKRRTKRRSDIGRRKKGQSITEKWVDYSLLTFYVCSEILSYFLGKKAVETKSWISQTHNPFFQAATLIPIFFWQAYGCIVHCKILHSTMTQPTTTLISRKKNQSNGKSPFSQPYLRVTLLVCRSDDRVNLQIWRLCRSTLREEQR